MEGSHCSMSLYSLVCQEDGTHLDGGDDDEEEQHQHQQQQQQHGLLYNQPTEAEHEYIELLVSKECSFENRSSDEGSGAADWIKRARCDSVRWILTRRSFFGFGPQTAYLAVAYLDRFLARRTIHEEKAWAMTLLSVACLSLAAKMEEFRPPALPEFQKEEYHFDSTTVQRMELLVLSTLEWRMSSVTPFSYLGYFATKFGCGVPIEDLISIANMFISSHIEAINLVDSRPSVIAAAAILAASGEAMTKDLVKDRISIISLPESLETEQVFACYSLMIKGSQKDKLKSPLVSSNPSGNVTKSSVDVIETTSFTAPSYKKRRLL